MSIDDTDHDPRPADDFQALSVIQPFRPMTSLPSECFPRWASLFINRYAPEQPCPQFGIPFSNLPHAF